MKLQWDIERAPHSFRMMITVHHNNERASICVGPTCHSYGAALDSWKALPDFLREQTPPAWCILGGGPEFTDADRRRVADLISVLVTLPAGKWHTAEQVEAARMTPTPTPIPILGSPLATAREREQEHASRSPAWIAAAARRKLAEVAMDASVDDLRARIDAIGIAERRAKIAYHLEQIEALKAEDAAATTPGGADAG